MGVTWGLGCRHSGGMGCGHGGGLGRNWVMTCVGMEPPQGKGVPPRRAVTIMAPARGPWRWGDGRSGTHALPVSQAPGCVEQAWGGSVAIAASTEATSRFGDYKPDPRPVLRCQGPGGGMRAGWARPPPRSHRVCPSQASSCPCPRPAEAPPPPWSGFSTEPHSWKHDCG